MRQVALAGDRVGLTIAPIMPLEGWRELQRSRERCSRRGQWHWKSRSDRGTDYTPLHPRSKSVLNGWYSGFSLEIDKARQVRKTTKFNSVKYVYTASIMQQMCTFFEGVAKDFLPPARIL